MDNCAESSGRVWMLTPMDFTIAFAVVSACSVTACLQFLALSPRAGEAVSGKRVEA